MKIWTKKLLLAEKVWKKCLWPSNLRQVVCGRNGTEWGRRETAILFYRHFIYISTSSITLYPIYPLYYRVRSNEWALIKKKQKSESHQWYINPVKNNNFPFKHLGRFAPSFQLEDIFQTHWMVCVLRHCEQLKSTCPGNGTILWSCPALWWAIIEEWVRSHDFQSGVRGGERHT